MNYKIYGPYEMPRQGHLIDSSLLGKKEFWDEVNEDVPGLADACGCYVYVIHGIVRYVGKTEKQTFRKECYAHHKLTIYNWGLNQVQGKPGLYFLAKVTPKQRFAKTTVNYSKDIEFLEDMLIGMAIRKTPDLLNIRGTKLLKNLHVPGIINSKKGEGKSQAVQDLKKAMGL